ncbi:FAD-dependent pyridine nucleotide-disulfide oxidoreductase [Novosphingobium nitrogenifigens DSM 19370]|uniref:FAD-dependent pyridine nucleotide-disulfide oxidoreductase n=1 Tax=Novosphingobium nitrogenifigens DSM 19370 TaxID=983920 RepID=F1Z890_9SPHN|nr:FAD-dependent oxidoreductase [Novosphingobium nitrogenifigens]EGD59135.1 FAD-dependent pyridine nucleotide-disulfide oxidoreductase [Novosphingobium nitrogenifigens DSM 19370]
MPHSPAQANGSNQQTAPAIAIVGSGPAGYYTAEAAVKLWGDAVRIDIFDRLPVPYGLIRAGVAPDHQSIKAVARRYETTALAGNVRFCGHVEVGRDVSVTELSDLYDAVILATGAPRDRPLDIPGEHCGNVMGSAAFVGWYNGHPDFADLSPDLSGGTAVVIGMGNVALDVARILSKTRAEFAGSDIVAHALRHLSTSSLDRIVVLGRRGPLQIMMTPKELGELGDLSRALPRVDPADLPSVEEEQALEPGLRKSLAHLRAYAANHERVDEGRVPVDFIFHAVPRAFIPDANGQVCAIEVEETRVEDGRAIGTGNRWQLPAHLVVSCIGYRTAPIPEVPFDERGGRFANTDGFIRSGLYCVGWARRGPSGTIGTNRPDGYAVIDRIAADLAATAPATGKAGRDGFDALATARGLDVVSFSDWKRIEEAETRRARDDAPREKFVAITDMIAVKDETAGEQAE